MTAKYLILFFLIPGFITGCTPAQNRHDLFNQQINWAEETPASVKTRICSAAQNLEILSAFFSLNMNPPPEKMMSSLSGVITIDSRTPEPRVRIQAFHLFGATLFDMVNADGKTKIYVPRKDTMYIGTREKEQPDTRGPQTIFANMMLEPTELIIQKNRTLEINTASVKLYLQDGWISLDPQSGLITTRHKNDLEITYTNYTKPADNILIPTTINITTDNGSFTATCTLTQIATPESLPETYFNLTEYKPEFIKKLKDLP
jgi:hypothetical protein